jgi:C-terminal processing protease CtpA/Prc
MKKLLLPFLTLGLLLTNCNKNEDINVPPAPISEEPQQTVDIVVQDFMWQTMNAFYLWQADVADLADDRFGSQVDYEAFLAETPDPEAFFYDQLLIPDDRFSVAVDNYKDLVNSLAGIFTSNGLEFGLVRFSGSDDVFGYVRYVIAGSDAATKPIARGDIFTGVDGQTLNINNYIDLLFGSNATYTLNMADIVDNTITPNGVEISLTKQENLVEDPVLVSKVLDVGGQNVGYLMYNQFTGESSDQLNQVFGDFKAANITDLVLDLRYNPGGSGSTVQVLASLIYDTNTSNLLWKDRYNAKIEAAFGPGDLDNNFVSTTGTAFGNMDAPLNNLNLSRVFVIATGGSASASELVMVGLEPYINVIHIGETTVGKNQGSNTFVDDPANNNFYQPDREDQINPDNQWAVQPIIITVENSAGFSDYSNGLVPDIELEEDLTNLGVLGDPNEPLLARAIQEISGVSAKVSFDVNYPIHLMTSSKMFKPVKDNLVMNKIPTTKNDIKN